MTHGSLFSGIGGFDLAAEWMGWENVFHCENNEFCQKVLKHHFPNSIGYGDIKETDFTEWEGRVDALSGGFPCQPYSTAGKRKGKDDDRHLWPEMLRAIREIQPRWVIGENVSGLLNWDKGMVLDEIKADLEAAGFEVFPPLVLPACAVNAPHRRNRVWIIAHAVSNGHCNGFNKSGRKKKGQQGEEQRKERDKTIRERNGCNVEGIDVKRTTPNSKLIGQSGSGRPEGQMRSKENGNWEASWTYDDGRWPTQPPVYIRDDGVSVKLDIEAISEKNWLEWSLQGAGNAIVPQLAFEIFKRIEQFELQNEIDCG